MCILTVMCVMLTVASMPVSAGVEVKGLVYASQITDKGLVLTGNTNLVMDRDLVLTSISGNYDLTVSGSGKLTVWAKWIKSDAISVASLNAETDLQVEAGSEEHCAIYATKGVRFTGDSLDVKGCTGIRTTGGDVVMDAVEVTITSSHGAGVIANSGSVLINADHVETADCSGGKASCQKKAVCTSCNSEYGELGDHSFSEIWTTDKDGHWKECICGEKTQSGAHSDENSDGSCNICSASLNAGGSNDPNAPGSPTTPDDPDSDSSQNVPIGLIIAIVIGCAVVGCGTIAVLIILKKKKKA